MPESGQMDTRLTEILSSSFLIRTTMTKRKSGGEQTVETTYVWDGAQRIVLSGYPGKRDWMANMKANPSVMLHTVEGDVWFDIPGEARIVTDRNERVPLLIAFIEHWSERPDFPRRRFMFFLSAIKLNRKLHLPWWGPFLIARRILDRMPCVEITFAGEPARRADGPPEPGEPRPT